MSKTFIGLISLLVTLVISAWWTSAHWSLLLLSFAAIIVAIFNLITLKNKNNNNTNQTDNSYALLTNVQQITFELTNAFKSQLDEVNNDITRVRGLLSDAIIELQNSFSGLNNSTQNQASIVMDLINNSGYQSGAEPEKQTDSFNFHYFAEQTQEVLGQFVSQIVDVSKDSMQVMQVIDDVAVQMTEVVKLLEDVKGIADKTNLLALNAAIEAARAGESGRGFAVVADEVRTLSQNSNRFSDQIREVVNKADSNIKLAQQTVSTMASRDMNNAIGSKDRIDNMLQHADKLNELMTQKLEDVSVIGEKINAEVAVAVRSLQFEDMTNQLLNHVSGRVQQLGEVLDMLTSVADDLTMINEVQEVGDVYFNRIVEVVERLKVPRVSIANQSNVQEGNIDLF